MVPEEDNGDYGEIPWEELSTGLNKMFKRRKRGQKQHQGHQQRRAYSNSTPPDDAKIGVVIAKDRKKHDSRAKPRKLSSVGPQRHSSAKPRRHSKLEDFIQRQQEERFNRGVAIGTTAALDEPYQKEVVESLELVDNQYHVLKVGHVPGHSTMDLGSSLAAKRSLDPHKDVLARKEEAVLNPSSTSFSAAEELEGIRYPSSAGQSSSSFSAAEELEGIRYPSSAGQSSSSFSTPEELKGIRPPSLSLQNYAEAVTIMENPEAEKYMAIPRYQPEPPPPPQVAPPKEDNVPRWTCSPHRPKRCAEKNRQSAGGASGDHRTDPNSSSHKTMLTHQSGSGRMIEKERRRRSPSPFPCASTRVSSPNRQEGKVRKSSRSSAGDVSAITFAATLLKDKTRDELQPYQQLLSMLNSAIEDNKLETFSRLNKIQDTVLALEEKVSKLEMNSAEESSTIDSMANLICARLEDFSNQLRTLCSTVGHDREAVPPRRLIRNPCPSFDDAGHERETVVSTTESDVDVNGSTVNSQRSRGNKSVVLPNRFARQDKGAPTEARHDVSIAEAKSKVSEVTERVESFAKERNVYNNVKGALDRLKNILDEQQTAVLESEGKYSRDAKPAAKFQGNDCENVRNSEPAVVSHSGYEEKCAEAKEPKGTKITETKNLQSTKKEEKSEKKHDTSETKADKDCPKDSEKDSGKKNVSGDPQKKKQSRGRSRERRVRGSHTAAAAKCPPMCPSSEGTTTTTTKTVTTEVQESQSVVTVVPTVFSWVSLQFASPFCRGFAFGFIGLGIVLLITTHMVRTRYYRKETYEYRLAGKGTNTDDNLKLNDPIETGGKRKQRVKVKAFPHQKKEPHAYSHSEITTLCFDQLEKIRSSKNR